MSSPRKRCPCPLSSFRVIRRLFSSACVASGCMRVPWARFACPGSAAAGLSCSELAESFVDGCAGELRRTIELQRDLLFANAGAAAAVGRAAPPWQLAIGTLIAAFLIYHHGRGMAWMALSLSLILFQFTCAMWQLTLALALTRNRNRNRNRNPDPDPSPNPHPNPNPNPDPDPNPSPSPSPEQVRRVADAHDRPRRRDVHLLQGWA